MVVRDAFLLGESELTLLAGGGARERVSFFAASTLCRELRPCVHARAGFHPLRIVSRMVSYVLPASRASVIAGTNTAS